jgi:hypothetical protein
MKTKLFLSHASEDKSFARPLYNLLRKSHDVWYDEYTLNVGDSIFESISRGLKECDYGVVVLSHNFFGKKWTNAELAGLFALEGKLRKIILPVWLKVTHEDVLGFSPILADRKAASGADGVEAVANTINTAISAAAVARVQEKGAGPIDRLISLGEAIGEQERSTALLDADKGMTAVREEIFRIARTAEEQIAQLLHKAPALGLSQNSGRASGLRYINLNGPNGLIQRFDFKTPYSNSASGDKVVLTLLRYADEYSGESTVTLKCREYTPLITRHDEVRWKRNEELFDGDSLVAIALGDFVEQFEREKRFDAGS